MTCQNRIIRSILEARGVEQPGGAAKWPSDKFRNIHDVCVDVSPTVLSRK